MKNATADDDGASETCTASTGSVSSATSQQESDNDYTAEEELHIQLERIVLEPNVNVSEKIELIDLIEPPEIPHVRLVEGCKGRFSHPLDWSAHFRKAYTVVMWIRPVVSESSTEVEDNNERKDGSIDSTHEGNNDGIENENNTSDEATGEKNDKDKRSDNNTSVNISDLSVLYRIGVRTQSGDDVVDGSNGDAEKKPSNKKFYQKQKQSSTPNQVNTSGVEVCFAPWRLLDDGRTVQTSLTAVTTVTGASSSPKNKSNNNSTTTGNDNNLLVCESLPCPPISLDLHSWSLVVMTHVFPYLKRPTWTLTVNGREISTGELSYPELAPPLLYNQNYNSSSSTNASGNAPILDWEFLQINNSKTTMDWHGLALYSQPISSEIQSLVAATGISSLYQYPQFDDHHPDDNLPSTFANLLPRIPSIPNWSKGSTMDGSPKVGIPLIVHPAANDLQQLSDSCFVIGANADVAGATNKKHGKSLLFPCTTKVPGTTSSVPKVGLLQPTPTNLTNHTNATTYRKPNFNLTHPTIQLQRKPNTKISPLTVQEFSLSRIVLPFFFAQGPPQGWHVLEQKQQEKYQRASSKHLQALMNQDGEFAVRLINLLANWVTLGGPRAHEQLLQEGILTILSVSMRKVFIRAFLKQQKQISQSAGGKSMNPAEYNKLKSLSRPVYIPSVLAKAVSNLIQACCGGWDPKQSFDNISPAMQIRRCSDLAMTALFGLGLDFDLWGCHAKSADIVLRPIATMYGGSFQSGTRLRNQMSVQFFLDQIRLASWDQQQEAEGVAESLSQLLQAMLLGSLSNRRSISQGEHDISACMGALSDCSLGSVTAHVILTALIRILRCCEIFPDPKDSVSSTAFMPEIVDEEGKQQLATRLGRNLLMGQFHDVVAPMLLSRTVFSGGGQQKSAESLPLTTLSWQHHWRISLLIFSWVASIAGPEGELAAKSSGSLLLASGLAGSLKGALQDSEERLVTSLFLPPAAAYIKKGPDWTYADLLSDRLDVMMPLLPGMVVSLLSHPSDSSSDSAFPPSAVKVLAELLTAVSGAFHRVFSSVDIAALASSAAGKRPAPRQGKLRREKVLAVIQAAEVYVPHLLVITMLIESHIQLRKKKQDDSTVTTILAPPQTSSSAELKEETDESKDSWIEVSSGDNDTSENSEEHPNSEGASEGEALLFKMEACQKCAMSTLSMIVTTAMALGGGETTTALLRSILLKLNESVVYTTSYRSKVAGDVEMQRGDVSNEDKEYIEETKKSKELAQNILCRLAASVLNKSLRRENHWEVWSSELGSSVSKLCTLVEEKELLINPIGHASSTDSTVRRYSSDQIILYCALLEILSYGLDITGWCQLILPNPPVPTGQGASNKKENEDDPTIRIEDEPFRVSLFSRRPSQRNVAPTDATSKLMLPVLQPCLRIVMGCFSNFPSKTLIAIPPAKKKNKDGKKTMGSFKERPLLEYAMDELDLTLTAGIVGLSFPNARDAALNAMSSLRRAIKQYRGADDELGARLCCSLLCKVAEEIRVRHEGERRRRETALFDAYDEEPTEAAREAAEASQIVEKMILGSDLITPPQEEQSAKVTAPEEVVFGEASADSQDKLNPKAISEDFVLFHENYQDVESMKNQGNQSESGVQVSAKMPFAQYDGLGATLDVCAEAMKSPEVEDDSGCVVAEKVLSSLAQYLDAWDANIAREVSESELVGLFDANININAGESMPQGGVSVSVASSERSSGPQQLQLLGAESAADAMSSFIEFANAEKSRLAEISASFLPNHRYSRLAYAERFCLARCMEIANDDSKFNMNDYWQRGIDDGNRDVRSRIITVPCVPQFRRYIPKYLDHGADESESNFLTDESETEHYDATITARSPSMHHVIEAPMDQFTQSLLKSGKEIVDITKKEMVEDDLGPNIDIQDSALDSFAEAGEYSSSRQDEPKETAGTSENISTDVNNSNELKELETSMLKNESGDPSKGPTSHHNINSSPYATPPDNSSSSLSIVHSAAAGIIEQYLDNCLHVKIEGSRKCSMLLTSTHLILEYDMESEGLYEGELMAVQEEADRQKMSEEVGHSSNHDEDDLIHERLERKQRDAAALRPRSMRWNLSEVSHIYLRRYRLRDSSIELFFIPSGGASFGGYALCSPSTSLFLDFGPGYEGNTRRDDAAFAIMKRTPPQALKQWPDRSVQFLHDQLSRLTIAWVEGRVTNFDYLLHLNMLSGRSYNDICQYPVMPWVLADYKSTEIPDLTDRSNFRDLSKPMGALNPSRLEDFIERFNTFADPSIPPFMYGSHYSTSAGVVLHFLVRLHPFAGLHRQLQGGHFDVADRLFSSIPRTWDMCTGSSAAEVKELTPEWYCNPSFLKNVNNFKLGTSQDGDVLGDVVLPPWAGGSPEKFVEIMRRALESEICSDMLPGWIDLIFGRKQQGPEAIKAHNVFFYLTYYGSVDVASIEDESLRQATELQIAHFGQCPMQLFSRPHVQRLPCGTRFRNLSFFQLISPYTSKFGAGDEKSDKGQSESEKSSLSGFGEAAFNAFDGAPLSHWVHLDAPPPGPHAPLVAVRLAGTDRCLAVDSMGVFHCFRWAWKTEEGAEGSAETSDHADYGCFVAQRELPRFRSVPRLLYTHPSGFVPPLAISKTLFAGGSVLLVLSDGDGLGGLGMQLVDPAKGSVRGEALVPFIHSARITCIAADPIGTAAGHGGVGGELAIVGSADGSASLWRFMSSHYLPLRPRVRFQGHRGSKIYAVAIAAGIQVVASVSRNRCCLFSVVNGTQLRSFGPPQDALELTGEGLTVTTKFADCPAMAISVQGYVVTVCETTIAATASPQQNQKVISLSFFTLEGLHLGSKPLETWRGLPHKISSTPQGTAILVCSGRGVSVHRLSSVAPLVFLDEWQVTESDNLMEDIPSAWDVDLGPNLNRPVVAAAGCSGGVLRLHALPGISAWSERHKKPGMSNPFAAPAKRITTAMREGFGIGSKYVGMGKEISKEVSSDVKERGVGGFLGNVMFRKNAK